VKQWIILTYGVFWGVLASTMVSTDDSIWDRYVPADYDRICLDYQQSSPFEPELLLQESLHIKVFSILNFRPYLVQLRVEGSVRPLSDDTKRLLNRNFAAMPYSKTYFFSPESLKEATQNASPDLIGYEVQVVTRANKRHWVMIQNKLLDEWLVDTVPGSMIYAYVTILGFETFQGYESSCHILGTINSFGLYSPHSWWVDPWHHFPANNSTENAPSESTELDTN